MNTRPHIPLMTAWSELSGTDCFTPFDEKDAFVVRLDTEMYVLRFTEDTLHEDMAVLLGALVYTLNDGTPDGVHTLNISWHGLWTASISMWGHEYTGSDSDFPALAVLRAHLDMLKDME